MVNFLRMLIMGSGSTTVKLTVCFSLMIAVMIANSIGGLLPLLAKKIKQDPAIMASPMITTIVDACSLIVYFNIAKLLLRI